MPRPGYASLTLDKDMIKALDTVAREDMCKNRAEVLRVLVRAWKREKQNPQNVTARQEHISDI